MLKEYGFSDRDICKLTGHKAEGSLNNYDPENSMEKKAGMADVLLMGSKRKSDFDDKENAPPKKISCTVTSEQVGEMPDAFQQCMLPPIMGHAPVNQSAHQTIQPFGSQYLMREQELRAIEMRG
ncbi:Hypothetical predicted protein, partial [Paramuricea clavata]